MLMYKEIRKKWKLQGKNTEISEEFRTEKMWYFENGIKEEMKDDPRWVAWSYLS